MSDAMWCGVWAPQRPKAGEFNFFIILCGISSREQHFFAYSISGTQCIFIHIEHEGPFCSEFWLLPRPLALGGRSLCCRSRTWKGRERKGQHWRQLQPVTDYCTFPRLRKGIEERERERKEGRKEGRGENPLSNHTLTVAESVYWLEVQIDNPGPKLC